MTAAKRSGRRALTDQQELRLCAEFIAGATHTELANSYEIGLNTVRRILSRRGVNAKMRSARADHVKMKSRPEVREQFVELGAPPADPLGATEWAHTAAALMAQQIATDPELPDQERHRQLRATLTLMNKLIPRVRLRRAEALVLGHRAEIDEPLDVELEDCDPDEPGPRYRAHVVRGPGADDYRGQGESWSDDD